MESSGGWARGGGGLVEGPLEGFEAEGIGLGAGLGVSAEGAPPEGGGGIGKAGFGAEECDGWGEQLFEVFLEPGGDGLGGVGKIEEGQGAIGEGGGGGEGLGAGELAAAEEGGEDSGEGEAGDQVEGGEGGIGGGLVEGLEQLGEEGFPGQGGLGVESQGDAEGVIPGASAPVVEEVGFSVAGAGGFEEDELALVEAHG